MSEPRTKAGRAMLAREALNGRSFGLIRVDDVLAIEAEAAAGHAECEANMDAEIERLTLALASESPRETALREAARAILRQWDRPAFRPWERESRLVAPIKALRLHLADTPASETPPRVVDAALISEEGS